MRKSLLLLLTVAVTLSMTACDVFTTLDQEPQNTVPGDQALTDQQGAEAVLGGLYDEMQGFMDEYTIFAALAADQASHSGSFPSWAAVDDHTMAASSPEAADQWNGIYDAVNVANLLIAKTTSDLENLDEQEAAEIRAQARTIRAFCYHGLVRWFGGHDRLSDAGVPIVLEPTESVDDVSFPSRSTVGEVYSQIFTDLSTAEDLLEGNPNERSAKGFVDNQVIDAMQARAYLYRASINRRAGNSADAQSDYEAARSNAAEVLAVNNTLARLDGVFEAQNSGESIWELQYSSQDANAMSFFARPNGAGGRYEYTHASSRLEAFRTDSLDNRLGLNVQVAQDDPFVAKYFRLDGSDHHYIFRVPEIKLIWAEALTFLDFSGNKETIVEQINDIRRRAYNEFEEGDNPNVTDFQEAGAEVDPADVTSQQEALDLIVAERYDELAYEGHRWHDLNRLGLVGTSGSGAIEVVPSTNDRRWPIPQEERDVNPNLEQNPGY